MLMAEFFGSGLQVLTSMMTLFLSASARPQAQPPALACCCVAITLNVPLTSDTGPTVHSVPDWIWVYPWQAGQRRADEIKKKRGCFTVGKRNTAFSASC